ncbi:MAG: hypothetical protein L3J24_01205 [Xanthomonadales bacterium]|nr:hypothetical protein [Xanthomonadales bacterium]
MLDVIYMSMSTTNQKIPFKLPVYIAVAISVVSLVFYLGFYQKSTPVKVYAGEPSVPAFSLDSANLGESNKDIRVNKPAIEKTTTEMVVLDEASPQKSHNEKIRLEWQRQAGYLSAELALSYYKMPIEELRELAENGNAGAAHKLGLRLARQGDSEDSLYFFKEAVLGGSLAAAQDLSYAYLGPERTWFEYDPIQGYAWRRVAEAMGASPSLSFGPVQFANREDHILALHLSHFTIRELQMTHYDRYGVPLPYYPQPHL